MDKAEIEKFKRNSGEGKVVLIGDDSFFFKPLPTRNLPELMYINEAFSKDKKAFANRDIMSIVLDLIHVFVKNSYPELDGEIKDQFVLKNFMILLQAMNDISSSFTENLTKEQKIALEKFKKEQGNVTNESDN